LRHRDGKRAAMSGYPRHAAMLARREISPVR